MKLLKNSRKMDKFRKYYIEKENAQYNCLEMLNIIIWKCHMVPGIVHAKKNLFKNTLRELYIAIRLVSA